MAPLPIKVYGEEVLRQKSMDIENLDGKAAQFLEDLKLTMLQARGLGLAANQVGRALRAFAIDLSQFDVLAEPKVFINPEIVDVGGNVVTAEEGCLSFPGLFQNIERSDRATIKSINLDGKEYLFEASGLVARVIQHEIDHLDGVLFIDHLTPAQRTLIKRKLTRIKAGERV
ncbi:MAG: peptide deformylase [Candidatus Zixiibacteriota bacterium]|nr:MAG: peptide deformylase [candidate division Zixibacteria bacterium]